MISLFCACIFEFIVFSRYFLFIFLHSVNNIAPDQSTYSYFADKVTSHHLKYNIESSNSH